MYQAEEDEDEMGEEEEMYEEERCSRRRDET